jgi:catechol 2,3-dioxygenase
MMSGVAPAHHAVRHRGINMPEKANSNTVEQRESSVQAPRTPERHVLSAQDLLSKDLDMDAVTLYVRDIDNMVDFYTKVIRLSVLNSDRHLSAAHDKREGVVTLGRGTTPIMVLRHEPDLPFAQSRQAGLFHTAILFESQAALAAVVLSVAQNAGTLYTGSADHLVSEAFYLNDPEGNGIELYWDRPRDQWAWNGSTVVMDSLWLDPNAFVQKHVTDKALATPEEEQAKVGHVHLQVGDTRAAREFYVDTLGFEATAEMPGALFVSAGGYHHHMAMNTWHSRGAGPRASSLGLGEVSILVPTDDEVQALQDRLKSKRIAARHDGVALRFEDPWKNQIAVSVN